MKISKKTAILILVLAALLVISAFILFGAALYQNLFWAFIALMCILCIAVVYAAIGIIHL